MGYNARKSKYAEWNTNTPVGFKKNWISLIYVVAHHPRFTQLCLALSKLFHYYYFFLNMGGGRLDMSQLLARQIPRIVWDWRFCKNLPINWMSGYLTNWKSDYLENGKSDYLPRSWLFAYLLWEISEPEWVRRGDATLNFFGNLWSDNISYFLHFAHDEAQPRKNKHMKKNSWYQGTLSFFFKLSNVSQQLS